MRRTAPVKLTYQVLIAVDNSQSMPLIGAAMMLWMLDVSQARCYPEGSRADLKKGGEN
jgi:midasin (ATPase involved in ribosome maturation)